MNGIDSLLVVGIGLSAGIFLVYIMKKSYRIPVKDNSKEKSLEKSNLQTPNRTSTDTEKRKKG